MAHIQAIDLPPTARLAGDLVPAHGFHLDSGQVLLVGRSRADARARIERDASRGAGEIAALLEREGQGVGATLGGMLELSDGDAEASQVGAALYYTGDPVQRLHVCSFATDPGRVWFQPFGSEAHVVDEAPERLLGLTTLWLNTSARDAMAARLTVVDALAFAEEQRQRARMFQIRSEAARDQAPAPGTKTLTISESFNAVNPGQARALLMRASPFLQFPASERSPKLRTLKVMRQPSADGVKGKGPPARDIDTRNYQANDRLRTVSKNLCFAVNDPSDRKREGFAGADVKMLIRFGLIDFEALATAFDTQEALFRPYDATDTAWYDAILAAGGCAVLLDRVAAEAERVGLR